MELVECGKERDKNEEGNEILRNKRKWQTVEVKLEEKWNEEKHCGRRGGRGGARGRVRTA